MAGTTLDNVYVASTEDDDFNCNLFTDASPVIQITDVGTVILRYPSACLKIEIANDLGGIVDQSLVHYNPLCLGTDSTNNLLRIYPYSTDFSDCDDAMYAGMQYKFDLFKSAGGTMYGHCGGIDYDVQIEQGVPQYLRVYFDSNANAIVVDVCLFSGDVVSSVLYDINSRSEEGIEIYLNQP
jgi:hypothetical protein